jgi:hypothetical protein
MRVSRGSRVRDKVRMMKFKELVGQHAVHSSYTVCKSFVPLSCNADQEQVFGLILMIPKLGHRSGHM